MEAKKAIIVVDYQNDFANRETWSLYVANGETLAPIINELMKNVKREWGLVLASRELHSPWHISFASNYHGKIAITETLKAGNFPSAENFISLDEIANQDAGRILQSKADFSIEDLRNYLKDINSDALWPDHCIEGTFGAQYLKELDQSLINTEIKKWFLCFEHPYSAFWWVTVMEGIPTVEYLNKFNVKLLTIVGLATDYCNLATVLDARKHWFEVEYPLVASAGVNPDTTADAIEQMRQAGAKVLL